MSMMLKGTVLRVAYKEDFQMRSTGEVIPHSTILQVMSESQGRLQLQDLSLDGNDFDKLKQLEGREILCPVRTWADRKTNQVRIFPEDGSEPEVLGPGVFTLKAQPSGVSKAAPSASASA